MCSFVSCTIKDTSPASIHHQHVLYTAGAAHEFLATGIMPHKSELRVNHADLVWGVPSPPPFYPPFARQLVLTVLILPLGRFSKWNAVYPNTMDDHLIAWQQIYNDWWSANVQQYWFYVHCSNSYNLCYKIMELKYWKIAAICCMVVYFSSFLMHGP